jgi:hypothetical protein
MSDAEVMGSQFHAVLVEIDRELAAKARAHGCPYCGGEMRLSYCCESCRRRTTPASVHQSRPPPPWFMYDSQP